MKTYIALLYDNEFAYFLDLSELKNHFSLTTEDLAKYGEGPDFDVHLTTALTEYLAMDLIDKQRGISFKWMEPHTNPFNDKETKHKLFKHVVPGEFVRKAYTTNIFFEVVDVYYEQFKKDVIVIERFDSRRSRHLFGDPYDLVEVKRKI